MTEEEFKNHLRSLGAREFEVVALMDDQGRALAAIAVAQERGANRPVPYALSLYDDPSWKPDTQGAGKPRRATNQAVEVECEVCGGDRFIVHRTRQPQTSAWMYARGIEPSQDPIEEMKPCPSCNASVDASFWRADGTKFKVAR